MPPQHLCPICPLTLARLCARGATRPCRTQQESPRPPDAPQRTPLPLNESNCHKRRSISSPLGQQPSRTSVGGYQLVRCLDYTVLISRLIQSSPFISESPLPRYSKSFSYCAITDALLPCALARASHPSAHPCPPMGTQSHMAASDAARTPSPWTGSTSPTP